MIEFKCVMWGYQKHDNTLKETEKVKRICKIDPVTNRVKVYGEHRDANGEIRHWLVNTGTKTEVAGIPIAHIAVKPELGGRTYIYKIVEGSVTTPSEDIWI